MNLQMKLILGLVNPEITLEAAVLLGKHQTRMYSQNPSNKNTVKYLLRLKPQESIATQAITLHNGFLVLAVLVLLLMGNA